MPEQIAVIGLGRFGLKLAQALSAANAEVIAIDTSRQIIEAVRDQVALAVRMDATEEETLLAQGIDNVDAAVVAIGTDFEANALTTSTLKAIGVKRVISRAGSEIRGKILRRIGADDIVFPEHESAMRWVHRLMLPQLFESIELGEGQSLVQLPAPKMFIDKTLRDLNLRQKYKINVVAIRRPAAEKGGVVERYEVVIPLPDTMVTAGDVLWIIASNEAISGIPRS
ncbi:MAG: TrkA family potassium uptake protein [Phycisphaerae bacterium]|jgi:trk system potassium uptake protein TrkA|nr:TrkA family potassium uptake protein [Phycisphaerae bacterium]